ncbi:acyl-CoA dehydrogenase family protein [Heyndrickxia sporothermodurans]|uniref:Acyl-CoA dehydrogenase family protein n=1 Tax=Heyndrickxia sporothermodurans TaxID=46224 RepID=A0AB37H8L6_9BACI|nr:acyl-CoA dehydrogenase family protein [Heyndrickxia sporothermodurans]MBL5767183.1 acyl-CoA dehydrogenase family protein [Heyndrickxia sporothermodurans]MBL5770682.1 acyl-CoA dehydrogenase family protein [Heyndrickxia sporothermodurans]MBL5774334.1 acyl-CoA dehydrogenase family protein [Heyndrickxia sporothermodurans]MBL5778448.1 acyl-CoA dehydrogenase family protein [Heyndrickxia sporothermodurans]MBL5781454.1 acyl-CoA dehydrogenase family protein [Heyndrickxia sporothermodurans]
MANQTDKLIKGGSFLIEDISYEQMFTPEDYSDEQKMIAKTTEDYVNNEVVPQVEYLEKHEFDRSVKLLKSAGDLGLLGADVPEEYGGLELDKVSSALISEKMAKVGGFSISHGAHVGIGSLPIVLFGNEEQKKKYLPLLATGEKLAAYALTEPSSGSDALGAKTTAKLNEAGTHYILNGEKQWITNAGFADVFVVYAKIDGDKFSAFIVEREYPGVSTGAEEKKMGIKSSSTRTLILEDAEVPVENLLGEVGKGHKIAFNILNIGRYKLGVGTVGGSKSAFEITVKYANQRKQFKTPISAFNLTKEKLATMASKIYAAESSVYRTVGLFDERMSHVDVKDGQEIANSIAEYAIECSLNKVFGSEVLDYVVDEGVQIHGGYGFMDEYEISRAYRDSRINRIFEGTNEINRLIVPGTLMKKAMKGELPLLQKVQSLQEELMMMMPEEIGDGALDQEKYLTRSAKKVALMVAGLGAQKFGTKLEQEQEVLVNVADIISLAYAMESVVLRTEKAIAKEGVEKSQQKILYTQIFCQESINEIEQLAKESVVAIEDGDTLRMMLSALRKLTRHTPINVIAKKREASVKLIEAERFVL